MVNVDSGARNKLGPKGFWGSGEKWILIFRELGSTGKYFRGAREQAHNFEDSGSLAKKQKKKKKKKHKEKPPIKNLLLLAPSCKF